MKLRQYIAAPMITSLILGMVSVRAVAVTPPLSLQEAERLAQDVDPLTKASEANALALREKSVAVGQLPDPQLTAGVFNVPLDSFSFSDNATTQIRFGVSQAFPRGKTLSYRQKQTESQSQSEEERARDRGLKTLQSVRVKYLDVYFQTRAIEVIRDSRRLFKQLVGVTEAQYASGRDTQQDVLRAELEMTRLEDREVKLSELESQSRADLARWIGERAYSALENEFPSLPEPPDTKEIEERLVDHPLILAEDAKVDARKHGVRLAREQYKPGFSLGVEYRLRQGNEPNGNSRPDMFAAMVKVDLPLFTEKRQDRHYAASQQEEAAARWQRQERLLEMNRMLHTTSASWARLGERVALYERRLIPEARSNAEASARAYQSAVTEFTTLMRARLTELETQIDVLRVRVDRAKAQAMLLYLAGEDL